MTMRLCDPLGADWPTPPVCKGCDAEIRPGQRYAIVPNTLTVVCVSCAGAPASGSVGKRKDESAISTLTGPSRTRLSPGQWSRDHAACQGCTRTDRPHVARGLCGACYRKRDTTTEEAAAS